MRLVLRANDGTNQAWDLGQVQLPLTIGRDADLAMVVIMDSQVSRVHCRLLKAGDDWVIEDLTSRNGTWVNGQRVARA